MTGSSGRAISPRTDFPPPQHQQTPNVIKQATLAGSKSRQRSFGSLQMASLSLGADRCPVVSIGPHGNSLFEYPLQYRCRDFLSAGIADIPTDIPTDSSRSARQKILRRSVVAGESWIVPVHVACFLEGLEIARRSDLRTDQVGLYPIA